MLEEAGTKPGKEERKQEAARKAVMDQIFSGDGKKGSGFADPALMFG